MELRKTLKEKIAAGASRPDISKYALKNGATDKPDKVKCHKCLVLGSAHIIVSFEKSKISRAICTGCLGAFLRHLDKREIQFSLS